jgi:hypothetical protein
LDLGIIGESYGIVPGVFVVVIVVTGEVGDDFRNALVQGKTLSNCEEWKAKVMGIPDGLEAKCENVTGGDTGGPSGGDQPLLEVALLLKKASGLGGNNPKGDDGGGLSGAAIAGIVVRGVVVVAAAVGPAVWYFVCRKADDAEQAKA